MNDTPNEFNKITDGFVIQTFKRDSDGKAVCTEQNFICGSDVDFEDMQGEVIDSQEDAYQPFTMKVD